MSSLRNFRFQKTKPVTTSPETGSEGLSLSQSPQVSQDFTQNGNGAKYSEESSEDIVPSVS